ncbi:MAG: cytidine/deoxycytidylate deaminase family protein [Candidatus Cloacimonadales bacterium]|nr:cytidine/deoxycytidylate deaminase family protein [Candidatus Cloacimonadota bacterium]MDD2650433.1 cytidine/deoxycytidylate deaminase family protein [Candidatus Cloacimonadota bacterium]MDD3501297.1 cytidine/deoxycytidylate deaminase family protein [Candidatus Cloacimonadota bacterium]MDX9976635.1 cytidine/deoxycytidylate deaminase family protein [Candidatus Cloacimonadales bacterium]
MDKRPSWHLYFIEMAFLVSQRATCLRRKVGALIVKNNQILSTGYNGAPKHIRHCSETGCLREQLKVPSGERHELCRGVHAEQNAIIQAAVNGTTIDKSIMYCTNHPCSICAKMLINAEINSIYIAEDYPDKLAKEMLEEAGIELILVDRITGDLKKLL